MALNSLQDLMVQGLQELYSAEQQALQAYPQLVEAVSSPELKQALQQHMQETQGQVQRLEQIFRQLDETPGQTENKVMQGILENGQKIVGQGGAPEVLDAAIVAGGQIIEHYEIAGYGTARTYAQALGQNEVAQLLEQTLQEEKQTDEKMTRLAEQLVNPKAKEAGQ
jgi:ferritin-like metal-binding protein YciE